MEDENNSENVKIQPQMKMETTAIMQKLSVKFNQDPVSSRFSSRPVPTQSSPFSSTPLPQKYR